MIQQKIMQCHFIHWLYIYIPSRSLSYFLARSINTLHDQGNCIFVFDNRLLCNHLYLNLGSYFPSVLSSGWAGPRLFWSRWHCPWCSGCWCVSLRTRPSLLSCVSVWQLPVRGSTSFSTSPVSIYLCRTGFQSVSGWIQLSRLHYKGYNFLNTKLILLLH